MKLKNILIVVRDVERSKRFYRDLFGLEVVMDFGENVILTEGLVLQEKKVWDQVIGSESSVGNAGTELYFEESHMDAFIQKLEEYPDKIRYLSELVEQDWGKRVVRLYDPDGHVIEVGEVMDSVVRRFYKEGMSAEQVAEKTHLPLETVKALCGIE